MYNLFECFQENHGNNKVVIGQDVGWYQLDWTIHSLQRQGTGISATTRWEDLCKQWLKTEGICFFGYGLQWNQGNGENN